MTRFWDGRTDEQTDGRSDCTPRPAFAFGDTGKNFILSYIYFLHWGLNSWFEASSVINRYTEIIS